MGEDRHIARAPGGDAAPVGYSPPHMRSTLSLALAMAACAPPPYEPPVAADGTASTAPTVDIVWPPPESEVVGCAMVVVDVENFEIVDFHDREPQAAGEGHYHVLFPVGSSTGYQTCLRPYCLVDLAQANEGNISLEVQLAYNGHEPLLGEDGQPVADAQPIAFSRGACTEGGDDGDTGDTGDTGDPGDSGTADTADTSGGGSGN